MHARNWMVAICLVLGFNALAAPGFPQRVLFVGNSYFYYNNSLRNHVRGLVEAAPNDAKLKLAYKSATIGGASLDHHPIEWLTEPGRIGVKEPFEVVILAGNSADALADATRQKFRDTVLKFDATIKSRGGKTALYMTPAYMPPHKKVDAANFPKIQDMYQSVSQEIGADLIPVGAAFDESYRRKPDLRLHDDFDGSHPNVYGTYLAASVVYAKLYGVNPLGNAYDFRGRVPQDIARYLQQLAWDVVSANKAGS